MINEQMLNHLKANNFAYEASEIYDENEEDPRNWVSYTHRETNVCVGLTGDGRYYIVETDDDGANKAYNKDARSFDNMLKDIKRQEEVEKTR